MGYTFVCDIENRPKRYALKTGAVFALCPNCQELMYTTWKDDYVFERASSDVDGFIIPDETLEARIARIINTQKKFPDFDHVTPAYIKKELNHCVNCGKKMKFELLGAKFETTEKKSGSTISKTELNRRYSSLVNQLEKEYKLIYDKEDIEYINTCEEKLQLADMPSNNDIAQRTVSNPELIIKYIEFVLAAEIKIKCALQYRQGLKLQKRGCAVEKARLLAKQQNSNKEELQSLEHTYEERIKKIKETGAKELTSQLADFNIPEPQRKASVIVSQDIVVPETPEPSAYIKRGAPNPPEKPIYQKPGFFNRKRVEEENKSLADSYQQQLTEYEQELERYNSAVNEYKEMLENQKAEIQRKKQELENENRLIELEYEEALQDYLSQKEQYEKLCIQNNTTEIEQKIKQAEKEYLVKKQMCVQRLMAFEQSLKDNETKDEQLLNKEISASEHHIEMLIKGRNTLLAYNIIFPKYRSIPILHTLLEYLNSGRCATLAGRDGAYNVYEAEVRADQMIAQLSQITDVLSVIGERQTLLYDEMCAIKKQTEMLNCSFAKAVQEVQKANANLVSLQESVEALHDTEKESLETLKETRSLTDDLVQETSKVSRKMDKVVKNTAVTAHYSAVTAYYSKQTAEMTDALGFMLALK